MEWALQVLFLSPFVPSHEIFESQVVSTFLSLVK